MAFRRDFEPAFMPFPKGLAMHDWWIGLNAELKGRVEFIYEPLIKHRCHGGNVTGVEPQPLRRYPGAFGWREIYCDTKTQTDAGRNRLQHFKEV